MQDHRHLEHARRSWRWCGRSASTSRRRRRSATATSSFFMQLRGPRGADRVRDLRPDRRADRHEVQRSHRVVHRHLPPLDRVLGVAEQLAHEGPQRIAAVQRGADLAVRGVDPVAGTQRVRRADVRRLLADRRQVEAHPPLPLQHAACARRGCGPGRWSRKSRRSSSPDSLGSRSGWTTRPSSSMTRMTSSFIGRLRTANRIIVRRTGCQGRPHRIIAERDHENSIPKTS